MARIINPTMEGTAVSAQAAVSGELILDRLDAESQPAEFAPPVRLAEPPFRFQVLEGSRSRDVRFHEYKPRVGGHSAVAGRFEGRPFRSGCERDSFEPGTSVLARGVNTI